VNTELLIEAVRNLLSVGVSGVAPGHALTCDQCNEFKQSAWGMVGGEYVCVDCIRTHAILALNHAEQQCAADAH
jgi:hypothetical protein